MEQAASSWIDADLIGMTLLAAVWGFTNPWMAAAAREKRKKEDGDSTKKKRTDDSRWFRPIYDLISIFRNWRFVLPFAINQSASLVFLSFVIKSDLSKAVCTINSLTLLFTAISGRLFFDERMDTKRVFCGSLFILSGLYLMSTGRSEVARRADVGLRRARERVARVAALETAAFPSMWAPVWSLLLLPLLFFVCLAGDDFYQLLGVSRDADDRTIRKAFKKLAIQKHPDKDPDNPNAHAEFIKINRAYEVLKDPDLRRRKIATLTPSEFQSRVIDSGDVWFINFYSTFCGHCHELAPTWREFARKMHGIVKIGAVNCAEYPVICHGEHVNAYPSLVVYPEHVFYQGRREVDAFVEFIVSRLPVEIWEPYNSRPFVVDFCDEMENCLSQNNRRMLAHMLTNIVNVATVVCATGGKEKICDQLGRSEGVAFYPAGKVDREHEVNIPTLDIREVHDKVLSLLPPLPELSEDAYRNLLDTIEEPKSRELLVLFFDSNQQNSFEEGELKKLPSTLREADFFVADCSKLADGCEGLHLGALPRLVFFRKDGNFLVNYAKTINLNEARSFVSTARKSVMISLNEHQFEEIRQKQQEESPTDLWLVDLFAPWCHPCMLGLAELSKLPHTLDGRRLRTGILDCDVHKRLCEQEGVNRWALPFFPSSTRSPAFPTTLLLFGQTAQRLVGFHNADAVVDFVRETLSPSVAVLGPAEFEEFVVQRPDEEIFVVDFFAPWCGPCQQLAPEFRKVARMVQEESEQISFGSVDCDAHRSLCQANGIRSYPTIRIYANGRQMDYPANLFLPSNVETVDERRLLELMDETKKAVLVSYGASWCSHCVQFAPIYDQASRMLEAVHFAKIDCAEQPDACARSGHQRRTQRSNSTRRADETRRAASDCRPKTPPAFVDVVRRVLGEYGHQINRDEL
ncbi:DnaJ-like protein subfamily C member 10 [Aphelenchoides fujianensis]|nr:DnaJ-like protein subfamily C member 10 [Aphelenchoides fujianensis]